MITSLLKLAHGPIYAKRIDVLSSLIVENLTSGDKVLDIGCGFGALGKAVMSHQNCPRGVIVRGLEKKRRGGEAIEVIEYKGGPLPFSDKEFDVVVLADVLHHERDEDLLLTEAARITRRILIVKDHKPEGLFGYWRVCFLDWAANSPHAVECLYSYHTKAEWRSFFHRHNLTPLIEQDSINLYPAVFNLCFGKTLHYFAVLEKV